MFFTTQWNLQIMNWILIFTFYIINQIFIIILHLVRPVFLIFRIKYSLTEVLEQPELPGERHGDTWPTLRKRQ